MCWWAIKQTKSIHIVPHAGAAKCKQHFTIIPRLWKKKIAAFKIGQTSSLSRLQQEINSLFSLMPENMQTYGGPNVTQSLGKEELPLLCYWWNRDTPLRIVNAHLQLSFHSSVSTWLESWGGTFPCHLLHLSPRYLLFRFFWTRWQLPNHQSYLTPYPLNVVSLTLLHTTQTASRWSLWNVLKAWKQFRFCRPIW